MSPRLMVVPLPRTCGPPFLTIDSAPPGFEERSFRRSFSRLPPSEASRPWTPNLTVISTGVPKTALQSKLPRAVVSEQIAVPNIPANHLNRAVAGLVHDAPFRRTRNGRAGGVPGPQRVPSIFGSVQTGAVHQFLHHPNHVDTGQPACFYLPMEIDGAEHRPGAMPAWSIPACMVRIGHVSGWGCGSASAPGE